MRWRRTTPDQRHESASNGAMVVTDANFSINRYLAAALQEPRLASAVRSISNATAKGLSALKVVLLNLGPR
jgi:hypothetical protein